MVNEIKPNYKYIFLGHFIIAIIMGVPLLLFPIWFSEIVNWPSEELYFTRVTGALMVGLGIGSILAFRETQWERVKIVVQAEIVWLILGVGVNIYGLIVVTQVFMAWVTTILVIGMLGAFGWMYLKHNKE